MRGAAHGTELIRAIPTVILIITHPSTGHTTPACVAGKLRLSTAGWGVARLQGGSALPQACLARAAVEEIRARGNGAFLNTGGAGSGRDTLRVCRVLSRKRSWTPAISTSVPEARGLGPARGSRKCQHLGFSQSNLTHFVFLSPFNRLPFLPFIFSSSTSRAIWCSEMLQFSLLMLDAFNFNITKMAAGL